MNTGFSEVQDEFAAVQDGIRKMKGENKMNNTNNEQGKRIFEKIKAVKALSEEKMERKLKTEVGNLKSVDEVETYLDGVIARLKENV